MFPRVTHPSATPALLRAFDLHVLSLPPAFALSQDQTLKFKREDLMTDHAHHVSNPSRRKDRIDGVHIRRIAPDMSSKRETVEVLPVPTGHPKATHKNRARTPPSAFLFLSLQLSNSHIFRCRKQTRSSDQTHPLSDPAPPKHPTRNRQRAQPNKVRRKRPSRPEMPQQRAPNSVAASPCVRGL